MPERPFSRDLVFLMPPEMNEWVTADDPVRYVAAFVDERVPAVWTELKWSLTGDDRGAPRYNPRVLLGAWLYGFMIGERSCRDIERMCRANVSARWLTGDQCPDHNTLWRFYTEHQAAMRLLLTETIRTAVACGFVDLAVMAVDGTKLAANATAARTMTNAQLTELLARLDDQITALETLNGSDNDPGPPRLPAELRTAEALRTRVRAALKQWTDHPKLTSCNLTDPDARFMKTRQGLVPGYNAQAAVVATSAQAEARLGEGAASGRFIVAAALGRGSTDDGQLAPLIAQAETNLAATIGVTVADAGYASGPDIAAATAQGAAILVPERKAATPYHHSTFTHDSATNTLTCPRGQQVVQVGMVRNWHGVPVPRYRGAAQVCRDCSAFGECTTNHRHGRTVQRPDHAHLIARLRHERASPAGQALMRRRKTLIEPVFGIIKEVLAGRRLLHRGLDAVEAEWFALATAFNLRTLSRFGHLEPIRPS